MVLTGPVIPGVLQVYNQVLTGVVLPGVGPGVTWCVTGVSPGVHWSGVTWCVTGVFPGVNCLGVTWCDTWCVAWFVTGVFYLLCYRGLLTTLLLTPYEAREAWAVTVARYCIEHCSVTRYCTVHCCQSLPAGGTVPCTCRWHCTLNPVPTGGTVPYTLYLQVALYPIPCTSRWHCWARRSIHWT